VPRRKFGDKKDELVEEGNVRLYIISSFKFRILNSKRHGRILSTPQTGDADSESSIMTAVGSMGFLSPSR
jgi:hypothetical protein